MGKGKFKQWFRLARGEWWAPAQQPAATEIVRIVIAQRQDLNLRSRQNLCKQMNNIPTTQYTKIIQPSEVRPRRQTYVEKPFSTNQGSVQAVPPFLMSIKTQYTKRSRLWYVEHCKSLGGHPSMLDHLQPLEDVQHWIQTIESMQAKKPDHFRLLNIY